MEHIRESMLANIVLYMREYQKMHNIKKQCVTNCQYLYDNLKANFPLNDIKVKAVIGISSKKDIDTTILYAGHVVVVVDEEFIFEPSYEVYSIDNIEYFDNIKKFTNSVSNLNNNSKKHVIKEFIDFKKIADSINNGEALVEKEYYNKQADYVQDKLKNDGYKFTAY